MMTNTPFDFIVVGAGSAGSVLARRLVDDGNKVAVLEAGGDDRNPMIAALTSLAGLWHGPEDWDYFTTEQEHCSGRRLHLPRGKVLGGSHALNAAIWVRGAKQDYDNWAYIGNPGWSWEDVLPVFKEIENYDGGASETRGGSGLLDVMKGFPMNPVQESIVEAAQEIGIRLNEDYNTGNVEGVSKMQLNVRGGKRFNTWHAYLKPIVGDENLTLITEAHVRRLVIEAGAVTGVEYEKDGTFHTLYAAETVLTAGALNSPELLLRSGVGPAKELRDVGVDPVHDLPGVGRNLQDHFLSPVIYTTTKRGVPFPETGPAETHLFWKSDADMAVPDTQPIHFSFPMYDPEWMEGPENGFTLMAGLVRPVTRGAVKLSGPGAEDPLLIDLGALREEQDVKALVASVRQCRQLGRAQALAKWGAVELYPGPQVADDELEEYVRRTVVTYHHQVGTCKMGVDADAVVDPRTLRVRGLGGIRVADASVMPLVTTGNTNAATIMIAERAAKFIRAEGSGTAGGESHVSQGKNQGHFVGTP